MIVGSHPEDHMVTHTINYLPFPSLIPVTNQVKPTSDGPVLM